MKNLDEKSNLKIKSKIPLASLFFVIALSICTVVRYIQYTTVISIENGFFEYGGGIWNSAYYICLAIFAVGLLLLYFADKKSERGIFLSKSIPLKVKKLSPVSIIIGAVLTAICGFLLALEAITSFIGKQAAILTITIIFAAIGYTFTSYMIFTKKSILPIVSIAFLLISAFCICQATAEFMQRVYTVNLSSRLIVLSANILLSVFFLSCGRITIQGETRLTAMSATIFGYSAALLIISDGLSRLFYYYTADSQTQRALLENANGFVLPNALFIIQGIAVLWIIYALSAKKNQEIVKNWLEILSKEFKELIGVGDEEIETPDNIDINDTDS